MRSPSKRKMHINIKARRIQKESEGEYCWKHLKRFLYGKSRQILKIVSIRRGTNHLQQEYTRHTWGKVTKRRKRRKKTSGTGNLTLSQLSMKSKQEKPPSPTRPVDHMNSRCTKTDIERTPNPLHQAAFLFFLYLFFIFYFFIFFGEKNCIEKH